MHSLSTNGNTQVLGLRAGEVFRNPKHQTHPGPEPLFPAPVLAALYATSDLDSVSNRTWGFWDFGLEKAAGSRREVRGFGLRVCSFCTPATIAAILAAGENADPSRTATYNPSKIMHSEISFVILQASALAPNLSLT